MDLADGHYEFGKQVYRAFSVYSYIDWTHFCFMFQFLFFLSSFSVLNCVILLKVTLNPLKANRYIWIEGKLSIVLLNVKKEIYWVMLKNNAP